jgi:hypothetical protein
MLKRSESAPHASPKVVSGRCQGCLEADLPVAERNTLCFDEHEHPFDGPVVLLCRECRTCDECGNDHCSIWRTQQGVPLCADCAAYCSACGTYCAISDMAIEANDTIGSLCSRHCSTCYSTSDDLHTIGRGDTYRAFCANCVDAGRQSLRADDVGLWEELTRSP